MKQHIILLRGVMPTGKNKVPMAPLRQALADAGLADVRTYIQSGNVLARSDLAATRVEALVHSVIEKRFGGDIAVVALAPAKMRRILERNPFRDADTARTYFTMLASKPDARKAKQLGHEEFPPDEFAVTGEVVYVHCPHGYGTSKLSNNFFERKLGVAATTRNYNTVRALAELSGS